jgi:hypothetical protein
MTDPQPSPPPEPEPEPAAYNPHAETEAFMHRLTEPDTGPLPELVQCTQAFIARLPSQRVIDLLKRLEPGTKFGDLMEDQPPRMIAFRALLRDYPQRDPTSLWMHAYDVEVGILDVDPTNGSVPTPSLPSVPFTG